MRFKCLVLDHDETVVQSEVSVGYPFFCKHLSVIRPGVTVDVEEYITDCHTIGFLEMCVEKFHFTPQELDEEHALWMEHIRTNIPDPFPGIGKIIHRQKASGGLVCVVSHSSIENISRDYMTHFGMLPDAIYGWDLPKHQRKPNTFPLLSIMEKYNLKPKDILVVDDSKLAWEMAAPLGVKTAFAAWGKKDFPALSQEMKKICSYTFNSTKELEKFLFD
ncbi:MAG: HAD family hydrolase [Oscillospiraceae bacterium]|nr:HAD family hydrolase [Oscillospiraceae bacterium]